MREAAQVHFPEEEETETFEVFGEDSDDSYDDREGMWIQRRVKGGIYTASTIAGSARRPKLLEEVAL